MNTLAPPNTAAPVSTSSQRLVWGVAACLLIAFSVCLLGLVTTADHVANCDFIEYWAAGQQLAHGANPYDKNHTFAIERTAGWHGPAPIIMFNPPSGLFLTLPLGTVSPKTGYMLWSLFILGAWFASVHMLWVLNGRSRNALHYIGFFFAPAFACMFMGQMAAFVLLGLTLFLYFHRTWPLLAGAALLLCGLKPHLFLPFWLVLLAWIVERKAYRAPFRSSSIRPSIRNMSPCRILRG